jgi:hypothetical protein
MAPPTVAAPERRRALGALVALLIAGPRVALARAGASPRAPSPPACPHGASRQRRWLPHPDPRPGIDASRVLPPGQLGGDAELIAIFDMVRRIPRVADGIRCRCGCAELPGYRSLLSCFEGEGMAVVCTICQGSARLAYELATAGRPLGVIRLAVDRRF